MNYTHTIRNKIPPDERATTALSPPREATLTPYALLAEHTVSSGGQPRIGDVR